MKIIVTGGAGFIGSCLVWKLNSMSINEIGIVDELDKSEKWKNLRGKHFDDYFPKDRFLSLLESGGLKPKPEVIVHLGACSSTTESDCAYLMENNYSYSRRVAEWALRNNTRFIYASSAATYGSGENGYSDDDHLTLKYTPLNMYGYSKHAFDLWVLKNRLQNKFVGLKFFNVYGPNEYHKGDMRSMAHKGYEQIKSNAAIRLFKSYHPGYPDGGQKRDFIYVKDALEIIYFFISNSKTGIYNVGTGKAHTWNDLASAMFAALKMPTKIEYCDMPQILKDKYQYFTEADMSKLFNAGYTAKFSTLNEAVKDYYDILETSVYL